ncbi:MAG: hypothetical protein AABX34_01505 [Nanoarchaeota archaeon]
MPKKALELSLTFMVVVIIAIVLFSIGVKFIYDIANETSKIDKISTDELDKKFAQLSCESSDKVCIGIIRKIIPKGSFDTFGIKIINIEPTTSFLIEITPSKAFDKQNNETTNSINFKYNNDEIEIEKNEEKSLGIAFEVPKDAVSGTYVFDIVVKNKVNEEFQQYDELEKVYVEVP